MAARLKTHTDYNFKQIEELQRITAQYLFPRELLRKRSFALSWGGLFIGIGLLLIIRQETLFLALVCCVLGVLLMLRGIFFIPMTAWLARRTMGSNRGGSDFFFEKSEILAVQGTDSMRYRYADGMHLFETEQNICLVMESGQGLVLDKSNVTGGTADELRSLLEEKCGKTVVWAGNGKRG